MRLAVLLLILPLAGCPAIDTIEGKPSPYKEHIERVALVVVPEASAEVMVVEPPAPEPAAAEEPEPLLTVTPPCIVTFRVNRCGPNNEVLPW